ncbi:MAG TPA: HNH endonuclease [Ginsengibacter sp.]|nr:HNH endonuclease [Ginsengibacter sp.]
MKEENKLALIAAFYISKFDDLAYKNLGYPTVTSTHKGIGEKLGIKGTTIQNMRDEFDPYHGNPRKGWHQRKMSPSREEIMSQYNHYSEPELRKVVEAILDPGILHQEIFNEIEKEEISSQDKKVIEGEVLERKTLSYKRNAASALSCKERDSHTCQACGFWHNNMIVECHHLKPLSMIKESVVSMDNLVTLCPTCHRLAHSFLREDMEKYVSKELLLSALADLRKI